MASEHNSAPPPPSAVYHVDLCGFFTLRRGETAPGCGPRSALSSPFLLLLTTCYQKTEYRSCRDSVLTSGPNVCHLISNCNPTVKTTGSIERFIYRSEFIHTVLHSHVKSEGLRQQLKETEDALIKGRRELIEAHRELQECAQERDKQRKDALDLRRVLGDETREKEAIQGSNEELRASVKRAECDNSRYRCSREADRLNVVCRC